LIFDAIDTNADGGIAAEEFASYFNSLGVDDEEFANKIFQAMDTNKDGSLSREEFSSFGSEFFLGQDPSSPSRNFFGPCIA
jgi:Ca2+-binding EF-hand superfamily protein